jgi:alpha-beta hydrolase superfamily lysophospholipase
MSSLIKLVSDTVPLYSRLAIFVGLAALAAVKLAPLMDEKHSVQSRITKKELAEPMDSALFPQYIRNPEGLYLFIRRWEVPNAVAHVFFAHGFAEHCSRYDHLARLFNARGISVHAMDHQGHGLSDGDRAHVERFQHFVRDFALFVQTEQHRIAANDGFPAAGDISASVPGYTRPPCFLLGHSMGGLICTHIALAQEQSYASLPPHWPWAGLMLSSPALALDPSLQNPAIIAAGKVRCRYLSQSFLLFSLV